MCFLTTSFCLVSFPKFWLSGTIQCHNFLYMFSDNTFDVEIGHTEIQWFWSFFYVSTIFHDCLLLYHVNLFEVSFHWSKWMSNKCCHSTFSQSFRIITYYYYIMTNISMIVRTWAIKKIGLLFKKKSFLSISGISQTFCSYF